VFRLVSDREPYAWVSVALDGVSADALADLIEEAWRARARANLVARYAARRTDGCSVRRWARSSVASVGTSTPRMAATRRR